VGAGQSLKQITVPRLTPESPAIRWMAARDWKAFPFQRQVWKAIARGRSGMLHATTGAGKTYAVWLGMLDALIVVAVAVAWFEVPLRGSVALLLAMCVVYLLCALGLGLFVSTISRTQQQAMMTTAFFFLLPMVFLSGFIFPIENMPAAIQPITYLIPLRYFLIILRGIFLKGVGLEVLWPQAAALLAWGLAMLALATLRSTKRLA
jgi:ABC-2 type transport system permease protein